IVTLKRQDSTAATAIPIDPMIVGMWSTRYRNWSSVKNAAITMRRRPRLGGVVGDPSGRQAGAVWAWAGAAAWGCGAAPGAGKIRSSHALMSGTMTAPITGPRVA